VFAFAPDNPLTVTTVPFGPVKIVLAMNVTVRVLLSQGNGDDCPMRFMQKKGV